MQNQDFPVILTDAARERISDIVRQEGAPHLRVFVQGGGCAGFSYGFMLEDGIQDDDLIISEANFNVLVDPFSAPLLEGATVDWEDGLQGSRFVIRNPKAVSTCGCGSSFSA